MWLWIITGLNIIVSVHGFASGGFPQSCGTLLPQHGPFTPQSTEAPFELSFEPGNNGDPFTVFLRSTDSGSFSGFMLEAREKDGLPVGRFSQRGSNRITLLDCEGNTASSVSQANNQPKTSFEVNWTPPESGLNKNIDLRATFTRSFFVFWTGVNETLSSVSLATTATVPSTTEPITTQSITQPKTTQRTTQPTTTQPTTTQRTTQPTTTQQPTTQPTSTQTPTTQRTTQPTTTQTPTTQRTTQPTTTQSPTTQRTTQPTTTQTPTTQRTTQPTTTQPTTTQRTTQPTTTQRNTQPTTTKPTTTQRNTQPTTTQRTTQPTTTQPTTTQPTTTQPTTTQRNTQPTTTLSSTQPNRTASFQSSLRAEFKKPASVLMVVDSALVVGKVELCNIITNAITYSNPSHLPERISTVVFLVLCGGMEIPALVLKIVADSRQATPIAMVCVAIALTILELLIASLPLGSGHNREEIRDYSTKVCSFIHEAFTLAFIYVCYLDIADSTNNRESWPLWVLVAYTGWIFLFFIWNFIITTQRNAILQRGERGSSMDTAHRGQKKKKSLIAAEVVVHTVSVIFIIGTIALAVAIIVGILLLPEE